MHRSVVRRYLDFKLAQRWSLANFGLGPLKRMPLGKVYVLRQLNLFKRILQELVALATLRTRRRLALRELHSLRNK